MSQSLLILTASAGNGHNAAAKALLEQAEAIGCKATYVDMMDLVHPLFRTWFKGGYENLVRKSPNLWGRLYRWSDRRGLCYSYQTVLDWIFCGVLKGVLTTLKPDWVICTHSLPQPRLSSLRRRFGFKLAVVMTDLHPHAMWLRGHVDAYFVPTESSKTVLDSRLGKKKSNISVTGIPVSRCFRSSANDRYLHTALLVAGAIGGGPLQEVIDVVVESGYRCLVVTGGNSSVAERLTAKYLGDERIEVLGRLSTPEMAERMAVATLIITKAGGATTFECLSSGCPILIYKPLLIPGQEEDNAEWLIQNGSAMLARNRQELSDMLIHLDRHPETLRALRAAGNKISNPWAAQSILSNLVGEPTGSVDRVHQA